MTPAFQVKLLADALRAIGQIAVEPGADPMHALLEAQKIADDGLEDAGMGTTISPSSEPTTD